MDVSVVIVNWNTKELLKDCINSIYTDGGAISREIIVVDNASSDGSVEMVKTTFPDVKLIANTVNSGYGAACNQGMKMACGRYVLLLNSDIAICDSAIEKTVKYADVNPQAGMVGCQVWKGEEAVQMTCFRFPGLLNLFLGISGLASAMKYNRFFGREMMLWWKRDTETEVDVISGMFMLVRAEALREVGYMDESYFMYFEETDWCYRFFRAGWKTVFWPGAKVIHRHGGGCSSRKNMIKMFVQFQKSMLLFFRKNYGRLTYFSGRMLLALSFGVKDCLWRIYSLLKGRSERAATELAKCRAAFRYCAFGIEAEDNLDNR